MKIIKQSSSVFIEQGQEEYVKEGIDWIMVDIRMELAA